MRRWRAHYIRQIRMLPTAPPSRRVADEIQARVHPSHLPNALVLRTTQTDYNGCPSTALRTAHPTSVKPTLKRS